MPELPQEGIDGGCADNIGDSGSSQPPRCRSHLSLTTHSLKGFTRCHRLTVQMQRDKHSFSNRTSCSSHTPCGRTPHLFFVSSCSLLSSSHPWLTFYVPSPELLPRVKLIFILPAFIRKRVKTLWAALAALAGGQSGQSCKAVTAWPGEVQALGEQSHHLPEQYSLLAQAVCLLVKAPICFLVLSHFHSLVGTEKFIVLHKTC